jgi:hypothetical protein
VEEWCFTVAAVKCNLVLSIKMNTGVVEVIASLATLRKSIFKEWRKNKLDRKSRYTELHALGIPEG